MKSKLFGKELNTGDKVWDIKNRAWRQVTNQRATSPDHPSVPVVMIGYVEDNHRRFRWSDEIDEEFEAKVEAIYNHYDKQAIALRYFCLGRGYFDALKAMEFVRHYHNGVRKDGCTPEFMHQIEIANYIRTLPVPEGLLEDLLIAAFVHDLHEDYNVSLQIIESNINNSARNSAAVLSKVVNGITMSEEQYYYIISGRLIQSIAKGADRVHNVLSMNGVFDKNKQLAYVKETRDFVIPMLKKARRIFPKYEAVFENIKHCLMSHCNLIEAMHED